MTATPPDPTRFAIGDTVTINGGTRHWEVTDIGPADAAGDLDLVKIWPVDEYDDRVGHWVSARLLRRTDQTMRRAGAHVRVLFTNWELLTLLEGRELVMSDTDGRPLVARLASAEELQNMQRDAAAKLPEDGRPVPMSRERALNLTQPLDVTALLARRGAQ